MPYCLNKSEQSNKQTPGSPTQNYIHTFASKKKFYGNLTSPQTLRSPDPLWTPIKPFSTPYFYICKSFSGVGLWRWKHKSIGYRMRRFWRDTIVFLEYKGKAFTKRMWICLCCCLCFSNLRGSLKWNWKQGVITAFSFSSLKHLCNLINLFIQNFHPRLIGLTVMMIGQSLWWSILQKRQCAHCAAPS